LSSKRLLVLVFIVVLVNGVDYLGLGIHQHVLENVYIFAGLAFGEALVIWLAINRYRQRGWPLVISVFLILYGMTSLLVGIEAVYLTDILTTRIALELFVNGAVSSFLVSFAAVWLVGSFLPPDDIRSARPQNRRLPGWIWRIPLCGFLYLLLYIFAGLLIAQPLATALEPQLAPAYFAAFTPDNPMLILGFQFLRGMLWTLLSIPLLRGLHGSRWSQALVLGLLFAVLMGLPILLPGELAAGIRIGHAVEVFVSNFLFGLIVTALLGGNSVQSAWLSEKSFMAGRLGDT